MLFTQMPSVLITYFQAVSWFSCDYPVQIPSLSESQETFAVLILPKTS